MQLDWNTEEITELMKRACTHGADKAVARHLEHLELHLKNHQNSRSFELRKTIWETVEEWAAKLDTLLTPEPVLDRKSAGRGRFGLPLWMPDSPKINDSATGKHRLAPKLELLQ